MPLPFLIILTFLRLKKFQRIFENYVKYTLANLDLHLKVQADLPLLDFALLDFSNGTFFQHKLKICSKPAWSKSISAFCCCLVAQSCLTLCDPMDCSMPGFPVLQHLPELAQTHVHWVSDVIQPSHPLLSTSPPAFNLSQHQSLFQWVSYSHQDVKLLELQPQHQSLQWIFRIKSFRIDWFGLLAVEGTLKSLLQHHSSKAAILQHSVFFMFQLPHLYMTPGSIIALTRQMFVGKVMSLLFNTLSRFVIGFFPRGKFLLISGLQSQSTVILEPKKRVCHCFPCFPIYFPWSLPLSSLFECWVLSQLFNSPFSPSTRGSLILLPGCWCFSPQSWFQLVLHPAWRFAWYALCIS